MRSFSHSAPGWSWSVCRSARTRIPSILRWQVSLLMLFCLLVVPVKSSTPSSGTLTDQNPKLTYTAGPFLLPNVSAQVNFITPTCDAADPCDTFTLNVNVAAGDASTMQIMILTSWPNPTADFDTYVFDAKGNLITFNNSAADPEMLTIPAVSGTYSVVVVPFTPLGQSIAGTILLGPIPPKPPSGTGIPPRYQNYIAPVSAGGAEQSGEPSMGVDWNPNVASFKLGTVNQGGVAFFTSNFHTFRVNFDDCSSPAKNLWEDATNPTETVTSLDPIGFCDHDGAAPTPGRLFQSQLAGATSILSFSDNDGVSWTQSQGSGQPAGVDHQTIGAGPYNPNSTPPPPPHPLYPNAVYYCSQDVATAFCSRSDNGGLTFGVGVPIYNLTQCSGLHGHVKVAPDGTVYVPNRGCNSNQAVIVSTDNGLTWSVRPIPDSNPSQSDPSVGIASDGTIYFGYQDGNGSSFAKIAVSRDRGKTWSPSTNVGAAFNIQNVMFAEVAAGDANRAAFMFLGTTAPGNYQDLANFTTAIWHAYVATTYDGGSSYVTIDATPNNPVQIGSICNQGPSCGPDRNLLDFNDLTIDSQGRAVGGYANGCIPGACDAGSPNFASRAALATVVRQSGGRRLFAAFDPVEPAVPAAPEVLSAVRFSNGVLLTWLAPDDGGSPITSYKIFRGLTSGGETLLKTVKASKTVFLDQSAQPGIQYFYRVQAVSNVGTGPYCGEVSVVQAPPGQSACVLPGLTVVRDASGDQVGAAAGANKQLDILSVSVAEPFIATNAPNKLYFTIKVENLVAPLQPNSIWLVRFTGPDGQERFVDMNTSRPTPAFEYGHISGNFNTDGAADPASSFSADGTIQIVIPDSVVGNLKPGNQIVNVVGETQTLVGAADTGLLETVDITRPGRYILIGNQSCALPPTL